MNSQIPTVTKTELQRIMIAGCHLHQWQGKGQAGIRRVFQEQGSVQLDPLNPAGRNHDLFFLARIPDYRLGQFERICYSEKLVFEDYFPSLHAISRKFFPLFYSRTGIKYMDKYTRPGVEKFQQEQPGMLEKILDYVREHGPTKGSDLAHLGKAGPEYASWKSNRISGTALEYLWRLRKLAIVERDTNFRKVYGTIENYFDEEELIKRKYSEKELHYQKLQLRLKNSPIIMVKIAKPKEKEKSVISRYKWFINFDLLLSELLNESDPSDQLEPALVQLENTSDLFIVPSNWRNLCNSSLDDKMRVIAPLDPLVWERRLLNTLFDFDYTWEVYKKAENRKWGYYVYPLLFKGSFIGRLEAKFDKKTKKLTVFNFQIEQNKQFENKEGKAFIQLLTRWKNMLGAEDILLDDSCPIQEFSG
ncbi:MAG: DNA glycosylase AlkZ-like family protein [Promethearchaeota archaeon]